MTWNLFGQYLNFVLASILIVRLIRLKLAWNYSALVAFVANQSLQAVLYFVLRSYDASKGKDLVDYRVAWSFAQWIGCGTEIWMVYALLIAILKQLPGILRFSLRFLNVTFALSCVICLVTVWAQYTAGGGLFGNDGAGRLASVTFALERATAFGLLLSILAILGFVLFFPIRVPRNLAVVSTGLCLALFVRIGLILTKIYLPANDSPLPGILDQLVPVACVTYWIFWLRNRGEETRVTLGRSWQTVPQGHLVDQLEALNAALLRAGEEPKTNHYIDIR